MPISKKWSKATKHSIRRNVPESGGVYELKAFGELVYIGSSGNLQNRLLTHLEERNPNFYRYETAGLFTSPSSLEQKHLESYGSTKDEMPPWNERAPRV